MAVLSAPLDSVLTVRYQTGTSAGGSPVIRQKTSAALNPAPPIKISMRSPRLYSAWWTTPL